MKKQLLIEETRTPDGATFALFERDGEYAIRVNGVELMSTRQHASEERLAELLCAPLAGKRAARVLIGGLGFGFTLKAALAALAPDATVVVAELMEAVIRWNRDPALGLAHDALRDPRVTVLESDVALVLQREPAGFDAILLDVDNGPAALSSASNKGLYGKDGLERARRALRPGGSLGVWSAGPDPLFAKLMEKVGYQVQVERARAHRTSGGSHTLFLGRLTERRSR
jgi:spermidine synthase